MRTTIAFFILTLFFLASCTAQPDAPGTVAVDTSPDQVEVVINDNTEYPDIDYNDPLIFSKLTELPVRTDSDGTKFLVPPEKILSGGPPKDGIPSIDNPQFSTVAEADEWIQDDELVIALDYKGVVRAYPYQILIWHEIVNDVVAGDHLAVTYCPLCGTAIAYERYLDGEPVEFGVSGKLFNSNLIMYDRKTDTYWQQIDGVAIVGERTGEELTEVNVDSITWAAFKAEYENIDGVEVLNRETGFSRNYGNSPYGGYFESDFLYFPVEVEDEQNRIFAKDTVHGIEINGQFKAYNDADLIAGETITDEFAGVTLEITKDEAGRVTFINQETGEEIIKEIGFWFSWFAFHPETELYGFEDN